VRSSLWLVAVVALLSSSAAMPQDQNNRPGSDASRDQNPPGDNQQPRRGSRPAGNSRPDAGGPNRPSPGAGPPAARPPANRPPAPARPPFVHPRPPRRFMSQGRWRPSIHGPSFRYPSGFGYRRWATGAILPPIFLSAPYYYDSYAPLGLGPPPAGYRWVRYGPDLLLVNVVTGRIADVVDGVFY
jgi:Ni/Co efflux regulator RcnB